jgi:cytochrome c biogenesis protein
VIGPDSDPANAPELDKLNLQSGQMYLEIHDLQNPGSEGRALTLEQGVPATVNGLTYTFLRESEWSGMQISHNPGIPIFWAAALMLIGGLAVVFYFPHRRIRGIVTGGEQATALVAPMARRDWSARRTFEQFAERMNERFPGEWTLTAREDGLQFDGYAADTAT